MDSDLTPFSVVLGRWTQGLVLWTTILLRSPWSQGGGLRVSSFYRDLTPVIGLRVVDSVSNSSDELKPDVLCVTDVCTLQNPEQ